MKLNLNFLSNLATIDYKRLALAHGEKAAIGVCGLLFLLFTINAIRYKSSQYSPGSLAQLTKQAQEHVEGNRAPSRDPVPDFSASAGYFADQVRDAGAGDVGPFRWKANFLCRPPTDRRRRGEPEYLAAQQPVVDYSRAAIELKPEAAPAAPAAPAPGRGAAIGTERRVLRPAAKDRKRLNGYRWVSMRMLVPALKQREAFARALNVPASNPEAAPEYVGFTLQRQYQLPDGSWSDWETLDPSAFREESAKWADDPDIKAADSQYIHPKLTSLLPKRVTGVWGADATHQTLALLASQEQQKTPGKTLPSLGAARTQRTRTPATARAKKDGTPEWLLFRYLDLFVQQDQTYRYRLKLTLKNPNFQKEPQLLENPSLAEGATRETPWSEPSPPITVPLDVTYVLLGLPRQRFAPEQNPGQTMVALELYPWNSVSGTMIAAADPGKEEKDIRPLEMNVSPGDPIITEQWVRLADPVKKIAWRDRRTAATDHTMLDLVGGERKLTISNNGNLRLELPAEMLVIDGLGQWRVHSQTEDRSKGVPLRLDLQNQHKDLELKGPEKDKDDQPTRPSRASGPRRLFQSGAGRR